MIFEALMTGILAWQVMMPAVNNAKYSFQIDKDGTIIRMNTQDGTMIRCLPDLKCDNEIKEIETKTLDQKQ